MRMDLDRVRANVREADTEDLLDRVTVFRAGMEPDALFILEAELRQRGVTVEAMDEHAFQYEGRVLRDAGGLACQCHCCHRPAIASGWGWHRLWGWVPVFPRRLLWCERHGAR